MMQHDSSYSPVLWAAIGIPIVSAAELFVDPATREHFDFFVLGFFYFVSVRYTLAVALGVYSHETSLRSNRLTRAGAVLWVCYFLVLILCSLLVPGAAIFGLVVTMVLTSLVLALSILQGILTLKSVDESQRKDIIWRMFYDVFLLLILIYESLFSESSSYQSAFFGVVILLIVDFSVSEYARQTLWEMWSSLKEYMVDSWKNEDVDSSGTAV